MQLCFLMCSWILSSLSPKQCYEPYAGLLGSALLYCSRFLLKGGRVSAEICDSWASIFVCRDAVCHLRLSTELAICPNALRDPLRKLVGEKTGTGASVKHASHVSLTAWCSFNRPIPQTAQKSFSWNLWQLGQHFRLPWCCLSPPFINWTCHLSKCTQRPFKEAGGRKDRHWSIS